MNPIHETALAGKELDFADLALAAIDKELAEWKRQLVHRDWEALHAVITQHLQESSVIDLPGRITQS